MVTDGIFLTSEQIGYFLNAILSLLHNDTAGKKHNFQHFDGILNPFFKPVNELGYFLNATLSLLHNDTSGENFTVNKTETKLYFEISTLQNIFSIRTFYIRKHGF